MTKYYALSPHAVCMGKKVTDMTRKELVETVSYLSWQNRQYSKKLSHTQLRELMEEERLLGGPPFTISLG